MMILPLHGTLDFHDGIAVVVFALTLAMGSLLASLRRRQRGEGAALTPRPDPLRWVPPAGAPAGGASLPEVGEGEGADDETRG